MQTTCFLAGFNQCWQSKQIFFLLCQFRLEIFMLHFERKYSAINNHLIGDTKNNKKKLIEEVELIILWANKIDQLGGMEILSKMNLSNFSFNLP